MTHQSILLALLLTCALSVRAQETAPTAATTLQHDLMPVPAAVQFQPGRLTINGAFQVAVKGYSDARLQAGIDRTIKRLEGRTGLEFAPVRSTDESGASFVIQCQSAGQAIPSVDEDESYRLEVSDKQARLTAPTVVGVLRGLETFLQLVDGDRSGYYLPLVQIQDKPRFPWRGLLIDSCRHFESVEVIKRNLDGMAAVKLNVFHWHLTENQGFRIESRRYPKLHQMGSDGLYYTQDQAREIIEYARERGIRVVPEFDMPGHTTAWFVGHPELASAPGPYQIERQYGIFDPAMDPTREEVYKFIDNFLGEMAALFPDAYMHIGGDEVNGKQWNQNPRIQAFMKEKGLKDNHALQAYFNQRLSKILQKHGKKMVGWDEVLHPDLPKNIVVQSWRGQESLAEAAKKGYTGILSSGYYLDHMLTAAQHYAVDPVATDKNLSEKEIARILGGEACMWGEYVSPENIDSRIWPRLAAVAERLWSPRAVADVNDMYRRLAVVSVHLEELGLTHNTYEGKMLRRLTEGADTRTLKTLVDVVEPVKFYKRSELHPITQMTPLTRLVDTARPDSTTARQFAMMVDDLLSDAPRFRAHHDRLFHLLTEWRDIRPALDVLTDRSPVLQEAEPLARDLSDVGTTGLEALEYLSAGVAPPPQWREAKLASLEQAAKPKAEVEIVVIPALKQLVVAAAEASQLKSMGPVEWKKRVTALASPSK